MLLNRHRAKKPVIEEIQAPEPVQEEVKGLGIPIGYEELTRAEIIVRLQELGIEHDARQKKESLIELLKAGK